MRFVTTQIQITFMSDIKKITLLSGFLPVEESKKILNTQKIEIYY